MNEIQNKNNSIQLDDDNESLSGNIDNASNSFNQGLKTCTESKEKSNEDHNLSFQNIDVISNIPINITVELGRAKIKIKELLSLVKKNVITLDKLAGESLNILANGILIATGEIVVVDNKYGIRIIEVINSITTNNLSKQ
ncbi:flagellar motor switch protein FliN [Buchnera aphidicola (Hormaphis cornu)]|nr:flagellar motor switch protein FliN [Buchnera aphidicola (Hormaphis cornu)]